ncbi:Phosphatase 2A regulatory B subunit family protein [Theobroma cacao]|uniref:Phosphatase 2A regulatory B subunit family protein n=1 Tax=Theobroma cacao TaxID=3641 RepID=A0A061EXC6_THECC|nr:Phosphatase 2A regulatory B subunit family protein [Theobroma cacao]
MFKGKRSIDKRKIKSSCRVTVFEKILLEINRFSQFCTYVSCAQRNLTKFSNVFFRESIDLVSSSLFRALPHSSTNATVAIQFGEFYYINRRNGIDDIPFQDPSWPHLELVYRFFSSLLKSPMAYPQLAAPCIKPSFILKLFDLFQSEDRKERGALVSVLQVIYRKFGVHRKLIRNSVFNVFYCCANEKHNGVPHLLLFLRSIVVEEEDDDDLRV